MNDRILFPTDGSEGATAVFEHVLDIAADHDATVHVLNVADTTHDSVTRIGRDVVDVLEREGESFVADLADAAAGRGVSAVTEVVQGGVDETIVAYAADRDIDLIAMSTRGRTGLDHLLLGSTTERVLRRSSVPVLSIRPDDASMRYPYRNVLVATDGSAPADAAVERAAPLAAAAGAPLHALSIVDVGAVGSEAYLGVDTLVDDAEETVAVAADAAASEGVETVEAVEVDASAPGGIRSYIADHDIDLVVLGTRGRTGVERFLLGSVAERTVRTATVPVVTVPGPDRSPE
ncbi:universal stress protein [Halorubrum laminariae]|uniref:Universal stress protein n=1 Tax=Halorubrum laminariae TaxID=1433523 RepID=A0ABD6BW44_9EURY|nr:universal stress protein [Halorubrum laminariae]